MQVSEVHLGAAGAVERLHIGGELNQIARRKTRRQTAVAQQVDQQPCCVAARAAAQGQRFFWRLHARLHADGVRDVFVQLAVDFHQKVDGANGRALQGFEVDAVEVMLEVGREAVGHQVGRQLLGRGDAVGKGKLFGVWLEEEVERVVHRHLHHQIHRDFELGRLLVKHQAGLVVGKGVLLPVDEVLGLDLERVRNHVAAAVRGRAQANDLWA